jgi:arylsulfatase A-like enzyme
MLKQSGYTTAVFGKWHVGGTVEFGPNAHGFEEFFGFLGPNIDFYTHREVVPHFRTPDLFENTKPVEREGYMTDLITERSVAFIEQQGQRQDKKPFFLYVSYNAPHWPFQPPAPPDQRWEGTPQNRLQGTRKDYVGMVESMDAGVGRILKALADGGLDENTLVMFSSDNGGERLSRNVPFFHHKATLWEGGIRVPCVLRWPGHLPIGKTSEQTVITMDLTASILAATGTAPPKARSLDGMDVLPILKGDVPLVERTLFWRIVEQGIVQKAVRKGRWKYVLDGIEKLEMLFDLETDPGERRSLFYEHPEIARELSRSLKAWEQDVDRR